MDLLSVNNAAPSVSLAIRALERIERLEARYRGLHRLGRPVFEGWLTQEPLVTGYPNDGALFELVRLPADLDAERFAAKLAADHETQVVPGSFFKLTNHIRLSTTSPPDELAEALARISRCLRDFT